MHYFDITVLFETLICISQFTIHTCYSKICGYVLFMLGSNPEFLPFTNGNIELHIHNKHILDNVPDEG